MIILSDLQISKKQPRLNAIIKFFDWLLENYKDETMVQLGDFFDRNSLNFVDYELKDLIISKLIQFKKIHILTGNHSILIRENKNILLSFNHLENISIYTKDEIVDIEGFKCLMLPYQYDMKYYNDIKFKGDFCFGHFFLKEDTFDDNFVDITNINCKKIILGHLHIKKEALGVIIPGIPIISKFGETNHPILKINADSSIEEIQIPEFFKIETIDFNESIDNLNKEWLYNIINCPDKKSVENKFKEFHIRWEGIELKKCDSENIIKFDFESNNLLKYFNEFNIEKKIKNDYKEICLKYLG